MKKLSDSQLRMLVNHYIIEYEADEIIPMIEEADISVEEDNPYITLRWNNGAIDNFRKSIVEHGDIVIECLIYIG